jgi:hypothetical protein
VLRKLLRRLRGQTDPQPRLMTAKEICETYIWAERLRECVVQHGGTIDMWGYDNPDGTRCLRYSVDGPSEMLEKMVWAWGTPYNSILNRADLISNMQKVILSYFIF